MSLPRANIPTRSAAADSRVVSASSDAAWRVLADSVPSGLLGVALSGAMQELEAAQEALLASGEAINQAYKSKAAAAAGCVPAREPPARWRYLACHPRLWLRVERPLRNVTEPGVYTNLEAAVSAARPGDTILIAAGSTYLACNIQIKKPLCIIGGGGLPDDTVLTCSRGSENALEFLSTCKIANLTIKAELGCCLLHRSGKLTIQECLLQCEQNPLDYLSFPIVSTAIEFNSLSPLKEQGHGVTVVRTRIEGGAKAIRTNGTLALQHVRAIYARSSVFFWFEVGEK